MKLRYILAMTAALSISATAFADDGEALFKKSGCAGCHKVDGKAVGPSFKDIAAKYKDDKGAQAALELKVRNGGKGSFGAMSMPATGKSVSDDSIKTIVSWILNQK
ncbi:MAG TPA: cytochrome C [Gallionella sp.]|jgi:cytochrome c|nr:c-type cytochrome [Gallionella sp.]OGS67229.1 MAG: cytochrome C [Gallionellales bacterium GWA2_54_124]OGT19688.1 MAG: cytochrome C [Gallionellales bacterium RIFOXYD12_FULL_53_10]HCI52027.1 cytochrome C [Gallionella sp.]